MNAILVLFAHPNLERSRAQRALLGAAQRVEGVQVRDLYERYPDFDVDVQAEQAALSEHDVIVLQHPVYWYSCPALLKQWLDLVWTYGWAYGPQGHALRGKAMLQAVSAGGGEQAYSASGHHGCTLRELLRPFERSAALCGVRYLEPQVVYDSHKLDEAALAQASARYAQRLEALRDLERGDLPWSDLKEPS